jgi:hypothetical protein
MIQNLDEDLYRILQKCAAYPEFADSSLHEGSIRHLIVEELEPSDIKSVQRNLEKTKDAIVKTKEYVDKFQLQDELQLMYDYMEALESALDKASKELVNVSFDSGVFSNFFGKKFSLPQITSAAIELNTKAVDFASGFHKAMEKIHRVLLPALKNSDPKVTVSDAAADDETLNLDKIRNGIQQILERDLAEDLLQKVKGFFKLPSFGKSRDILSAPELNIDMKALSKQIADELVNAKIENLLGEAPPKGPDTSLATDLEDEMKDTASDDDASATAEDEQQTETAPGEEPVASEEEAVESQEEAESELEDAVRDAATEPASPKDAAFDALDAWVSSLSSSSQKSLQNKNRIGGLKDSVSAALDDSAKAVENEVAAAIQAWRNDNEETLLRSKRFAKKNFDSLQDLIPKLASVMMKKASESKKELNRSHVRRFVFSYLERHTQNRLDEQSQNRWQKIAGL